MSKRAFEGAASNSTGLKTARAPVDSIRNLSYMISTSSLSSLRTVRTHTNLYCVFYPNMKIVKNKPSILCVYKNNPSNQNSHVQEEHQKEIQQKSGIAQTRKHLRWICGRKTAGGNNLFYYHTFILREQYSGFNMITFTAEY